MACLLASAGQDFAFHWLHVFCSLHASSQINQNSFVVQEVILLERLCLQSLQLQDECVHKVSNAVQYTWDKQLETWVKSSVMLGGARKEPTVISPKQYCRRFRVAISSYFVSVPSSEQALPCLDPDALM